MGFGVSMSGETGKTEKEFSYFVNKGEVAVGVIRLWNIYDFKMNVSFESDL